MKVEWPDLLGPRLAGIPPSERARVLRAGDGDASDCGSVEPIRFRPFNPKCECQDVSPQLADPIPLVGVVARRPLRRDGSEHRRKAPKNLFTETDLYTIKSPDGRRDLRIERGLSQLEGEFARIRREVLEPRLPLEADDRIMFLAFVAAMRSRTKRQRDHLREEWGKVQAQMEEMRRAVMRMTPERRKAMSRVAPGSGPSLDLDDVSRLAREPLQHMLPSMVQGHLATLLGMNIAVLCTDDPLGFITSDYPCVVMDLAARTRPFPHNVTGLVYETAELTMPLSPSQMLLVSWKDASGYIEIPSELTTEANREKRYQCESEFVVRRQEIRAAWFPPDPWPADAV